MTKTNPVNGQFNLIQLPYAENALAPIISAETIQYHYGKHLLTYINNLNALLPGSTLEGLTLKDIVMKADGAILNNAGQILNHNLYFTQFMPAKEDNAPHGNIAKAIETHFGAFAEFQKVFEKQGTTLFGSGWVWLSADAEGKLKITQEPNAGNPMRIGFTPLLTFDVWEHAYYVDYRNRRADHLSALWQLINWEIVEQRYNHALS